MSRSDCAHSTGYRCTFCGLPQFGKFQMNFDAADGLDERVVVGRVGAKGPGGQERSRAGSLVDSGAGRAAELPQVDCLVVARRQRIAIESGRHIRVPDHSWRRVPSVGRVSGEHPRPADVVEVSVGVDERVHRRRRPRPHRLDDPATVQRAAGIERHQSFVGVDEHHM